MFCLKQNGKIVSISTHKQGDEWEETKEELTYSLAKQSFLPITQIDKVAEEKAIAEENAKALQEEQIEALKAELANTDYVAIKIAEGVATKEEYADVLAKRAELRKQINALEN